jgi:poly(3-hydroxybutyrate) depolymerase
LKNVLDDKEITLKNNLYKNSLKKNKTLTKEYFLATYEYNKKNDKQYKRLFNDPGNVWIIKKNNLMAGLGNFIVKDYDEFTRLVQKLKSGYKIDEKKIHITGMSNGAYFSHIVAKNNSETIASVAAHSGMVGLEYLFGINAKRKYPVLLIHGTNDGIFKISTARSDMLKYKNEYHKAHLIEVNNLGHEWANKININDSIYNFFIENPLP